jgi:hypothetical protein
MRNKYTRECILYLKSFIVNTSISTNKVIPHPRGIIYIISRITYIIHIIKKYPGTTFPANFLIKGATDVNRLLDYQY